jgi:hypothetical protein
MFLMEALLRTFGSYQSRINRRLIRQSSARRRSVLPPGTHCHQRLLLQKWSFETASPRSTLINLSPISVAVETTFLMYEFAQQTPLITLRKYHNKVSLLQKSVTANLRFVARLLQFLKANALRNGRFSNVLFLEVAANLRFVAKLKFCNSLKQHRFILD